MDNIAKVAVNQEVKKLILVNVGLCGNQLFLAVI